jgi:hypothetical protein
MAQGYKEYKTERVYMARMGDWRDNKDIEIPLDGVGGVSIVVKADVHREGSSPAHQSISHDLALTLKSQALISPLTPSRTKPRLKVSRKWPDVRARRCTACPITLYGTETPTRSPATLDAALMEERAFLVAEPNPVRLFRIDRICCLLVFVFVLIAFGEENYCRLLTASSRLLESVCLLRSAGRFLFGRISS